MTSDASATPFSLVLLGERSPIQSYGGGGFGLASGRRSAGSILILDDGIYDWPVADLADLTEACVEPVFASLARPGARPDFFLLGVGAQHVFPSTEIRRLFLVRRLGLEVMNTGAACRTCNVLLAEGRSFCAGLIAV